MIFGIVIGLLVGIAFGAFVVGIFGANPHAELEEERWKSSLLNRENLRLQAEARQRGEVA